MIVKTKRELRLTLGDECRVVIHDFERPIKKKKYDKTMYYHYRCRFLYWFLKSKPDDKLNKPVIGNHIVMIPAKTAWLHLYQVLKEKNIIDYKNLDVTFIKYSPNKYGITMNHIEG